MSTEYCTKHWSHCWEVNNIIRNPVDAGVKNDSHDEREKLAL